MTADELTAFVLDPTQPFDARTLAANELIGQPFDPEPLLTAATTADAETRELAVYILQHHDDPRIPPLLRSLLVDAELSPTVGGHAAEGLATLRDGEAIPLHLAALADPAPRGAVLGRLCTGRVELPGRGRVADPTGRDGPCGRSRLVVGG